jgi:hypothetical protein
VDQYPHQVARFVRAGDVARFVLNPELDAREVESLRKPSRLLEGCDRETGPVDSDNALIERLDQGAQAIVPDTVGAAEVRGVSQFPEEQEGIALDRSGEENPPRVDPTANDVIDAVSFPCP